MEILSYSPSVEAYASVRDASGSISYVDLSKDIVSVTVGRNSDAASTFSITLQNPGWKYNGVFSCFDGIVIYATKTERVKLFSGFISRCDAFSLYQSDFHISGFCTLYRLQRLFFDAQLISSQKLMWADAYKNGMVDNGYSNTVRKLLEKVGGWPSDMIEIQESIPQEVLDWASAMYSAQHEDESQLVSMLDEFYEILQTHGPQVSGSFGFHGDDSKASPAQKRVAEIAENSTAHGVYPIDGFCGQWVGDVYAAAGFPGMGNNGIDYWIDWGSSGGTDITQAPLGSAISGSGSGSGGAAWGHIGIRVTDGRVAHNWGGRVLINTYEEFDALNTAWCRGQYHGAVGWVWPRNRDLSKES